MASSVGNVSSSVLSRWLSDPRVVFGLAVGVRALYAFGFGPHELYPDSHVFLGYARSLLEGDGYALQGSVAGRPPGYPLFLSVLLGLAGDRVWPIQAAQVLLDGLTCVLIGSLSRRLFPDVPAWPAALLAALYPPLWMWPAKILTEPLFILVFTCFLLLCSWERWFAAGCALGAASLVRPDPVLLPVWVLAWIFLDRKSRAARGALRFMGGFLLFVAPWVVRNALLLHAFVPGHSYAGHTFYVSINYYLPLASRGAIRLTEFPHEILSGIPEAEWSGLYLAWVWPVLESLDGWTAFKLALWKSVGLWYPFNPGYDAAYIFLLPFWAWALFRRGWDRGMPRLCAGTLLYFWALFSVIYAVGRYRSHLSPVLLCFAAWGLADLFRRSSRRNAAILLAAWALFQAVPALGGGAIRHWIKAHVTTF